MKSLFFTIAVLSTGMSLHAKQSVERKLAVSPTSYVEIEHVNGLAKIQGWDKDEVKVSGELGERTEDFIFERNGNDVLIKVEVKKGGSWINSEKYKDNLTIFVPRRSSVNYQSVNAKVDVSRVLGGSEIQVVNGNVNASELEGRVSLASVNGQIRSHLIKADKLELETVNGNIKDTDSNAEQLDLNSVNGDIESNNRSAEVSAETVNGSIELDLAEIEELELNTVNGSIMACMGLGSDGRVEASSVGGAIKLQFDPQVSARFDIQTHAGGRISNQLSDHKAEKAKYGPSRWLKFNLNKGKARVNVSTVSGRIELNKK